MGRVVVVGLGPAGPDQLTVAAVRAIAGVPPGRRFLRTTRHPAAVALGEGTASFDRMYDSADTIDDVYSGIVAALVGAAAGSEVLYAVPGSPLVAERTVELLLADPRVTVELVPGMSFTDLAWARLGVDPVAAGTRLVDGHRFAVEAAGERGPLLVAQCDSKAVLSDIKLAVESSEGLSAVVLSRLGLPDESVRTVAWDDLDREVEPDHLTSVYIPVLAAPVAGEVARFAELVRTLRERCPWDREQTHASLTRHLLEETYEVLEAIGALDPSDDAGNGDGDGDGDGGFGHLEEELGDLLFQVVFHATLAAEEGRFTLADVARGIHDKLVHRHPHVFGPDGGERVEAATTGQVVENWERIKKAEKGRASVMDGIAPDLPSLLYAHKVQRKAEAVGLVGPDGARAGDAVSDMVAAGQLLFDAVDRIRRGGVDPEAALRATAARYRDRFVAAERAAAERGLDLGSLDRATVTGLWQFAKPTGGG